MDGGPDARAARRPRGSGAGSPPAAAAKRRLPAAACPALEDAPEPVCSLAAAYGSSLAAHGKWLLHRHVDRLLLGARLKCYFAVDTLYVARKLGLLLFPFLHQEWQVRFQEDTPVAPRFDVNAIDLYIPVMAFLSYLLVAGLALGTQNRFSPDLLGLLASSALAWLVVEVLSVLLGLYLVTVNTGLNTIDLIALLGYKYVGMIVGLLAGLLLGKTGYHLLLSWCCITIFVFMIRTLRLKILSEASEGARVAGSQLRMYLTVGVAGLQPLLMYWLTFHLVP